MKERRLLYEISEAVSPHLIVVEERSGERQEETQGECVQDGCVDGLGTPQRVLRGVNHFLQSRAI